MNIWLIFDEARGACGEKKKGVGGGSCCQVGERNQLVERGAGAETSVNSCKSLKSGKRMKRIFSALVRLAQVNRRAENKGVDQLK